MPKGNRWIAYHFYYHEDPERILRGCIEPTVTRLLDRDWISGFFFLYYRLGGPHVRLRLKLRNRHEKEVADLVQRLGDEFLDREPSQRSLDEVMIERETQALVAKDPYEADPTVYPDNFVKEFEFEPEVKRYGGQRLLEHSLDFFALSSFVTLYCGSNLQRPKRPQKTNLALKLLLHQALGYARNEEELRNLLGYAENSWGKRMTKVLDKADKVYSGKKADLYSFVQEAVASSRDPTDVAAVPALLLREGAKHLSGALRREKESVRGMVGVSHLHMTANRLRLVNPEEVYIGRLLSRALSDVLSDSPMIADTLQDPESSDTGATRSQMKSLMSEARKLWRGSRT